MFDYNKEAGNLLRRLRTMRGLTLEAASLRLNTSAPMLSRKERGEAKVERVDIRLAIEAYELSRAEARVLWATVGMLPDTIPAPGSPYSLRSLAQTILPSLSCPAYIIDPYWFLCAWNAGVEALWGPSLAGVDHVHVIDDLFSERQRRRLGAQWERFLLLALYRWYLATRSVAGDADFRGLLAWLEERWGAEFTARWGDVRVRAARVMDVALEREGGGSFLHFDTPLGAIEYLATQSLFELPEEHCLVTYIPVGAVSQERNELLLVGWEGKRAFLSSAPCMVDEDDA